MSDTFTPHPDRGTLLRLLDDDLSGNDQQVVQGHLDSCRACQSELDEVRDAAHEYLRFHAAIIKTALPPAPKPWVRLDVLAAKTPDRSARQGLRWFPSMPSQWLAAAAAVAAIFVVVRLTQRAPEVKAAELLQKARSAESVAPVRSRSIRLKSRKFAWDRPARLSQGSAAMSADASGIRQLLESAGYDWRDPLSATAYAGWHDRLAVKQDRIADDRAGYVIHTTTTESLISDASLTLGTDLRAVACTLRFGEAEALEMSELPDEDVAISENARRPTLPADPPAREMPARAAGPAEELQVVAALHRIGADLGEPIEVRREGGNVLVNVTGVGAQRQAELTTALAGLPAVRLQFEEFRRGESQAPARGAVAQVDAANEFLSELSALPGSGTTADLADQLGDGTEKILNRAYALRGLARRFPPQTTSQLAASDVVVLCEIVLDHAGSIETSLVSIGRLMRPVLPGVGSASGVVETKWQDVSQAMPVHARELDQLLNASGAADSGGRKLRIARALAELTERLNRLRASIQP